MYSLKNKVQLIGFMGNDPEVKHLSNGKMVAHFSIATSETYKNASGKKVVDTQWHHLTAWGKTAEIIEKYTHKGNEVAVEGKLMHRTYEDKEGIKRLITEVVINDVLILTKKADNENN